MLSFNSIRQTLKLRLKGSFGEIIVTLTYWSPTNVSETFSYKLAKHALLDATKRAYK